MHITILGISNHYIFKSKLCGRFKTAVKRFPKSKLILTKILFINITKYSMWK
jgi:hypothetical protein